MNSRIVTLSAILLMSLCLQGCISVHEEPDNITNRGTTIGEELEDLAEAYDEGLLSQTEYNRLRNRILNY